MVKSSGVYMKKITTKQKEVINFIKGYIKKNGISPSLADISKHFGFHPNAAFGVIEALERKGYIETLKAPSGRRVPRGIKVLNYQSWLV